jgi:hypothetical protein
MAMKRWFAAGICAVFIVGVGSAAIAGEVTGSGKNFDQNQGVSWCSFSGLNDDPLGLDPDNGPGGTSQSYGQEVRLGFASPHELTPGIACNPNRTFLPPQPNRNQ